MPSLAVDMQDIELMPQKLHISGNKIIAKLCNELEMGQEPYLIEIL